jgi:prolyl oligopeptidase
VAVADPYRWLENDVRNDNEVRGWVEQQNKVTNASSPRCRCATRSRRG